MIDNRDYFTRPSQAGGRTVHDYGHTRLGPCEPVGGPNWLWAAAGAAIVIALVAL